MAVISAMFEISKPVHSESRTVWYVINRQTDEAVMSFEIGSKFRYASGSVIEVVSVDQPKSRVTVRFSDGTEYTWFASSLLATFLTKLSE